MPPSTPPYQFHSDEELVNDVDSHEEEGPWCYCRTDIRGSTLIGCDNPECAIQSLYMASLKLDVSPKGKWICLTCWRNEQRHYIPKEFFFTMLYSI